MEYRVVPARPEHLAALAAIESAAAALFPEAELPPHLRSETQAPELLREAQAAGRLWVALAPDGAPVGFALARLVDRTPHLEEVDVHPDHGRRGIGAALVRALCAWARANRHSAVTLATFRHLPWNAPFYERLGFRALAPGEPGPELQRLLEEEARRGLDPARRVAMRLELAADSEPALPL
jgi:GNAT superfamily N-acetyltransferase